MKKYNSDSSVTDRIEHMLQEKTMRPAEFQKQLGIQSQGWNNWKKRGVPGNRLFDIATLLGVTMEWLSTGVGAKYRIEQSNVDYAPKIAGHVPLISWVQAGEWCEAVDNYAAGDAEEWMPCPLAHSKHTYALRIKGDSMTAPHVGMRSYPENAIVFVDPERALTNGCRVIAKLAHSDEATFKEYREDAGRRFLKPLNPQYPIQEITDETRLCGVVIGLFIPE